MILLDHRGTRLNIDRHNASAEPLRSKVRAGDAFGIGMPNHGNWIGSDAGAAPRQSRMALPVGHCARRGAAAGCTLMFVRTFPSATLALALLSVPAWAADTPAHRYVNARFGFSVEVPAGFAIKEPPPENGDGRIFHPGDPAVTLTAFASGNANDDDMASRSKIDAGECLPNQAIYQTVHAQWAVLSCVTANGILYQKTAMRGRPEHAVFSAVRMTYPIDQRSRWDAVAVRAARSLRPAPGR